MMILVTTLCLAAAVNAVSDADWFYAEIFAKRNAFPLTGGAYTNNKDMLRACINRADGGGQVETKGIIEAPCEYDERYKFTCKGYTALLKSPIKPAIAIVFRGTDQGFPQLVREALGSSVLFSGKISWAEGGSVSSYFNTSFTRLWEKGLRKQFLDLLKKSHQSNPDIWITGHSLGGAMATLAASWLTSLPELKKWKGKIKLVTFGAPRVGDKKFSDILEKSVDYIYRITHKRDPVPHIPYFGYHHAGKEIWYKNEMTYTTEPCDVAKDKGNCFVKCAKSEDNNCAQNVLTNVLIYGDHTTYYLPKTISEWGNMGCPLIKPK